MEPLSVFITTFNNATTLPACLESVKWADEIVILDSFSTDSTPEIATRYGCQFFQHKFLGYGPQKQRALEHTRHRWVLLLDADEMLTPELAEEIRQLLATGPQADGYTLPRLEQMFWRMSSRQSRLNGFLRLFDKTRGRISEMPIHAAPQVDGQILPLKQPFYHFGETSIHVKVDKINVYSSGLVTDKQQKGQRANPWIMIVYPPLVFLRSYFLKRSCLNGWPGFMNSVVMSFYAFLKYAKLYEAAQFNRYGDSLMPPGAPPMPGQPQIKG